MTESQIRELIRLCENKLKAKILFGPSVAWGFVVLFALGLFTESYVLVAWIEATLALIAGSASLDARKQMRDFQNNRAQRIWKYLSQNGHLLTNRTATPATKRLFASIAQLYFRDPNGELLPLPQALRLLDTHHRQQQRLVALDERLAVLSGLRWRLQEKLATLHELGEVSESGEKLLRELGPDEQNVAELKRQIEASCARLELLLPGIEHALQVRLLHREVSQMSGAVSQNNYKTPQLTGDEDAGDIERQITREIETYLQLERESEAHFR